MKKIILLLLLTILVNSCKKDPSAGFSYTGTLQVGQSISFNNLSKYCSSFTWDFGNGVVSTEVSPYYAYPKPGNYMVVLTAEGNGQTLTASKLIPITGTTYSITNRTAIDLFSFVTFYWTGTAIEEYHEHGSLLAGQSTGIIITNRTKVLFGFKFEMTGDYFFSANPYIITPGSHNELTIDNNTQISGKSLNLSTLPWYGEFMKIASNKSNAAVK